MQAAVSVSFNTIILPLNNSKNLFILRPKSSFRLNTKQANFLLRKTAATGGGGRGGGGGGDSVSPAVDSVVDYNSLGSVFPAEACEIIGGETCDAVIYPEAKLTVSTNTSESTIAVVEFEREYLDYNQQKTVFPDEACDDLGGEFCDPENQIGVSKEKTSV